MIKKISIILLAITLTFFESNTAYALNNGWPATGNDTNTNSSGKPGSPTNLDGNGTNAHVNGTKVGNGQYECYYSQSIGYDNSFTVDAYDLSGESIVPYSPTPTKTVKSGTWVGINAFETSFASWSVSNFHVYEIRKNYKCTYHQDGETETDYASTGALDDCTKIYSWVCNAMYSNGQTYTTKVNGKTVIKKWCWCNYTTAAQNHEAKHEDIAYYTNFTCPKWNDLNGTKTELAETKKEISSDPMNCRSTAIGRAKGTAAAMVGGTTTSLEYLSETVNKQTNKTELKPKTLSGIRDPNQSETVDNGNNGYFKEVYSFEPSKVCFNLKTAQVSYNNCQANNYTIELSKGTTYDPYLGKNVSYWYYFIPLTAKTSSNQNNDAYVKMYRTQGLSFEQCENGMKNNEGYELLISPGNGRFIGDYKTGGKNSNDYQALKASGKCYFSTVINFKVKQEFYNEVSNKLRGYGTYFRQIDVSNPFPNGLSANSYWNGFYDANNKKIINLKNANGQTLNASRPFDQLTYRIYMSNSKINSTRAFNNSETDSDGVYTSWKAMNRNGTSSFIKANERRVSTNSFYKLGCGPANKDWEGCK